MFGENILWSPSKTSLPSHRVGEQVHQHKHAWKGCMEKTPGCWEHISMVWASLKDARLNQKGVSTIWLDIANAYCSTPHQLIFHALKRYGVSDHYLSIIKSYFKAVYSKSFSESCPSSWHQQHKGIFAGCTISIILFLAGINLVIEYTVNCTICDYISSAKQELHRTGTFEDAHEFMISLFQKLGCTRILQNVSSVIHVLFE